MDIDAITQAFATLGHPGRLAVLRLLMRFAPQGVRPTEIAAALELKPNTLSHHLADLEQAGLISVDRQGRSLFYAARLDQLADLVGYLAFDAGRNRPEILSQFLQLQEDDMTNRPLNVLFICSGNSARSVFAEAILADAGKGRFKAHSAGTRPGSQLNPVAIDVLQRAGLTIEGLRAKHISEFQGEGAPQMDFVFTVCDQAATEDCAPWPGQPLTAHWGLPDPVKAVGTDAEKALAFAETFANLRRRIQAFAALPFAELEKVALQHRIDNLGGV